MHNLGKTITPGMFPGTSTDPALAYCIESGGTPRSEETPAGTMGYCGFPDGSECEEWAFYRGECAPAMQGPAVEPPGLSSFGPPPAVAPIVDTRTIHEKVRDWLKKYWYVPAGVGVVGLIALSRRGKKRRKR